MSVVIAIGGKNQKIAAVFGSMINYCYLFWSFLPESRIAGATSYLFGYESAESVRDVLLEESQIFWDWAATGDPVSDVFHRRWKYHRFLDRNALREDWVPPLEYFLKLVVSAALPQEPQHRRTIYCSGQKRVIRVHQ